MKITAHTLVQNEERFVWYAVMSVIDFVDEVLLWDTGSTDGTAGILKEINRAHPAKVSLRFLGKVNPQEFTQVRNEMLKQTKTDWFAIVDGDEVWWESGIKKVTEKIKQDGAKLDSIGMKLYNLAGDIYHVQPERLGKYRIDQFEGHLNIRFVRNIQGLEFGKPHGQQGLLDWEGNLIQERDQKRRYIFDEKLYLHFTNLPRSLNRQKDIEVPKREKKLKYVLGETLPFDFYYPEVFFRPRPMMVESPWKGRNWEYVVKSVMVAPVRRVKELVAAEKVGY